MANEKDKLIIRKEFVTNGALPPPCAIPLPTAKPNSSERKNIAAPVKPK